MVKADAAYFKSRGLKRYTLILPETSTAALQKLAEETKLSQSDLITVMVETWLPSLHQASIEKHLAAKVDYRRKGSSLASKIAHANPDVRKRIEELLAGEQS